MLNMISDLKAADARAPFSVGACLPSVVVRPDRPHEGTVAFTHPRAFRSAALLRQRPPAAGAGMALGQPNPVSKQYPYSTRIAASGGAEGPHPVREPEPA
jgi:hypothetical protein